MPPSTESAALLARVSAGSSEALGEVYARHAEAVYRLAYRLTASRQDAEDVLQDVFLGLPRALGAYREQGHFEAWLKRLAARVALMKLRARKRKREDPMDALDMSPSTPPPPTVARIALRSALEEMPEGLRTVFMLKEVEGYSHAEIAELLGISAGASAVRLSRAWKLLRKRVGQP